MAETTLPPTAAPLLNQLADRWWVLTLRGIAGILFGILTFIWPGATLVGLVILFGAYAIVNGAINLGMAAHGPAGEARWGSLLFEGIASIIAGVLTLLWPGITALVLLVLIAAWAIVTGVSQIAAAIRLRRLIHGEWLLGLTGVLSVAFGVLLLLSPAAGALAVVLWVGAYALAFGVLLVALSLRLRSWSHTHGRHMPTGGVPAHA